MNNLYLFFYYQKFQIIALLLLVHLPYGLVSFYLPTVPYMHYFFIIALFLTKVLVFNEGRQKNSFKAKVQKSLIKELKKNPSNHQIFKRLQFIQMARNLTLLIGGVVIILMAILFQKF